MPDILGSALTYLEAKRRVCLIRQVRYVRGDQEIRMDATPGRTTAQVAGPLGILSIELTDFIITVAGMVDLFPPQDGDRVIVETPDDVQEYELCGLSGEPAWRWSDPEHRALRLHCKYLGEVEL